MKKFLLLSMILIVSSFAARSQATRPASDTLCFPVEAVRTILIAAEQGKVAKQQVVILGDRIKNLEGQIAILEEKDSVTVKEYEKELAAMREERAVYQDQLKSYERLLRKERRKRVFTGLVGIATTVTAIYLGTR